MTQRDRIASRCTGIIDSLGAGNILRISTRGGWGTAILSCAACVPGSLVIAVFIGMGAANGFRPLGATLAAALICLFFALISIGFLEGTVWWDEFEISPAGISRRRVLLGSELSMRQVRHEEIKDLALVHYPGGHGIPSNWLVQVVPQHGRKIVLPVGSSDRDEAEEELKRLRVLFSFDKPT